jgi:lysophospholipase L1-like esterase
MLAHMPATRPWLWHLPSALGATAAIVLGTGFVLAMGVPFGERLGPPPAQAAATAARASGYRIVALGDSLTAGTGDARAGGYPARLARMLNEGGHKTVLVNLAVPGAETADVLARLEGDRARAEVADADLLLVSAGGNDLTHAMRPMPGQELADPVQAATRARANLRQLVARLRALNDHAPIRLIGLYNPFDVLADEEPSARAQLLTWNDLIDEATHAHRRALAIPIADLFQDRPDRLARDHYHPGPLGHELIARRVLESLPEGDEPLARGAATLPRP